MLECAEENQTQHHLGARHGFGPVQSSEYIYFAVFDQTSVDGDRLAADSFENKALKKDGQSVSRASFTTRKVFDDCVVKPNGNPKGGLTGVAAALVESVRTLQSRLKLNSSELAVRSFCVLDHVLQGDYDSHATINFGERTTSHDACGESVTLSQGQIKAIRETARLELADVFGPIRPVDEIDFAQESASEPPQEQPGDAGSV